MADAADEKTGVAAYDFYVNADNIFLQTELKTHEAGASDS